MEDKKYYVEVISDVDRNLTSVRRKKILNILNMVVENSSSSTFILKDEESYVNIQNDAIIYGFVDIKKCENVKHNIIEMIKVLQYDESSTAHRVGIKYFLRNSYMESIDIIDKMVEINLDLKGMILRSKIAVFYEDEVIGINFEVVIDGIIIEIDNMLKSIDEIEDKYILLEKFVKSEFKNIISTNED